MLLRRLLLLLILILGLSALASCAPGAMPTQPQEVVKTVEVQVEGETKIITATPVAAPASTQASVAEATRAEPTLQPTPTPLAQPSAAPTRPEDQATLPLQPTSAPPSPTSVAPAPTSGAPAPTSGAPAPAVEGRIVEVEWPQRMRLGESDVVRLMLIPAGPSYILTAEFPEHQVITQTVDIPRLPGYELYGVARLDGVGFEIAPNLEQAQFLIPGQTNSWRWSIQPRRPGQQRLALTLLLRWAPSGGGNAVRETSAYTASLDVQVISLFGLSQAQALAGGFFGLLFGGGLSLFAVVLRPRPLRQSAALRELLPNPALEIELPAGLGLTRPERALLQSLFSRYARLVIEQEFLSGYSGARTFLALPIRPDGRADAYTIAKLGELSSIRDEFANYETYVKDTLPPITARIQHAPVATPAPAPRQGRGPLPGLRLAALQYTFIGEPGSTPTSLRQTLLADPDPRLLYKLLDTFGPNWWLQRRPHTFRLGVEYDRVLPTHLVIEPARGSGNTLDGRAAPGALDLQAGDLVSLRHFAHLEARADGRSLSLQGSPAPGQPALRVRWLSLENPEGASGRVVATRHSLLRQFCAQCDLLGLPDPLLRLPDLLGETIPGSQSTIHGDLNLENILVGPGDLLWLIDFAQTRDGHTLYDFAHLEAELIAHILAPRLASAQEYLTLLENPAASPHAGLHALRQALHEIAARCLFNPSQRREYHLALALSCLGALKFTNLEQHAKHLLYLTAAHILRDL
ncbi:MAG: phosphotransferase [Chloroflexota bacterium]